MATIDRIIRFINGKIGREEQNLEYFIEGVKRQRSCFFTLKNRKDIEAVDIYIQETTTTALEIAEKGTQVKLKYGKIELDIVLEPNCTRGLGEGIVMLQGAINANVNYIGKRTNKHESFF